ncbi:50S ribosomal protein L6 [Candidatus Daviesbacteria bacterium]|nr:50S ribosomal protein L6 [Candidatus Daviesbacteria bacterium]
MSRIGDAPVLIVSKVTVEKTGKTLSVSGPKGNLKIEVPPAITVEIEKDQVIVKRKSEQKNIKALHGLTRSLIANMVKGVTDGWSKNLELVGVGFRAQSAGNELILNVGYSHPVNLTAPQGITFEVSENTKIKVSGIDKQLVGQVAANIRKVRTPDVYKGKGIRYEGEYVRKKLGKTGKIGAAVGGTGGKS